MNKCQIARSWAHGLSGFRDVRDRFHQESARFELREQRAFTDLLRESAQALEALGVRVKQGIAELARDPKQLVAVFVADTDGERHGDDAAVEGGPETIEKLLVVAQKNDHFVAAARTDGLQVIQNAHGARIHFRIRHAPFDILSFNVSHASVGVPIVFEHVDKSGVLTEPADIVHRGSTVIMRLDRGRRLICASNSMGSSLARVRRKRRIMVRMCTSISNMAMFSPMQWRGPTAKGI